MPVNALRNEIAGLEEEVLNLLRQVMTETGGDVVTSGQVYDVVATGGAVRVLLDSERISIEDQESLTEVITPLVESLPRVERAVVKPRPRSIAQRDALPGIRHVVAVHSGKGGRQVHFDSEPGRGTGGPGMPGGSAGR